MALSGGKKLMSYMIDTAPAHERSFKAGPVWNLFDDLIAGPSQNLRYSFDNVVSHEVTFPTSDLESYAAGDASTALRLENKIDSLLRKG